MRTVVFVCIEQFLEVLVPLYVRASCDNQHSIHHVRCIRIDKMIQEVWIRGLQEEHQTPPVEGKLFQFHLYYVLFDLHIFEEEIVKHVFLEIFFGFFLRTRTPPASTNSCKNHHVHIYESYFHLRLFFSFTGMDTVPRLLPDGQQGSENNMMFLGIDVSPVLSAFIAVWLFLLELCLFLASNIQENFHFLASLVYRVIYNGVKYWLLNGPTIPVFLLGGYQGMEQRDICSLMKNLPSTYFLEGSGKDACDEAIHFEVTSRTTVVLTAILTLFFVYGIPRFSQLVHFVWTYNDNMRREQYARDDFLRRERQERDDSILEHQQQRRREEEVRQRNARATVRRNQTMEKNAVLRQIFLKMMTILSMNDVDTINKITEMRNILDSLYERRERNLHYQAAIQEIDWQPKRWKIKGSSSTEVIIHQLENAIAEDISNANTDGEEEDDDNN